MIRLRFNALVPFVLLCALSLGAQSAPTAAPTITIRMYDARTGHQITPSNFLIRIDHQDEIRSEGLHIDDEGTGRITLPSGSTFLSVQGSFEESMAVYFNCDSGMEKEPKRHWYAVSDILSTGVIAPNECFKGKYESPRFAPKPGELDFYVRLRNWRDADSY
jgi:hypothetical protein